MLLATYPLTGSHENRQVSLLMLNKNCCPAHHSAFPRVLEALLRFTPICIYRYLLKLLLQYMDYHYLQPVTF